MGSNSNLHKAKNEKNNEFYTQLVDVARELMYYKEYFRGKVVFCNCDVFLLVSKNIPSKTKALCNTLQRA